MSGRDYSGAMSSRITDRILRQTGIPRLCSVLSDELPASDLQSLLLSVFEQRAERVQESQVLAEARRGLVAPCGVDARVLHRFDSAAYAAASDFEAVDLSPVCPFGTTSVLGGIDQNNVLTAIRRAEVLGDSTVAMALECARRRRELSRRAASPVRLCGSHRVIRLQPFTAAGHVPHFRLFGLTSAGRHQGDHRFEIRHLAEHLRVYLMLFRTLNAKGFALRQPLVELSDLTITEALLERAGVDKESVRVNIRAHRPEESERLLREAGITLPAAVRDPARELDEVATRHGLERQLARLELLKKQVVDPLRGEYPEAEFRFNLARLEGLRYYTGLCLRISPRAPDGARYAIADGGLTDWTARLLADRKERLLTSGIGSQFVCWRYRHNN